MGRALERRLKQRRSPDPHQEFVLNLLVTANHVRGLYDQAFAGADLTRGQYNLLRILNGAYPDGWSRGEIASRLVERAPDLTRMIDRLADRKLVQRARSSVDARRSIACITPEGRALIEQLEPEVEKVRQRLASRVGAAEAATLSALLERIYEPDLDAPGDD